MSTLRTRLIAATACCTCIAGHAGALDLHPKPGFVQGTPITTHYDGVTNDLLTAGLGASGIQSDTPPTVSNPPTAGELRRLAIYTNYRALVDITTNGGFGRFYGPSGLIAGDETIAFARTDDGDANITLMVQVPDSYNPRHGCIVTGPSSGSRGIYGAIGTAGEWGLKHGCAVAYTDKGTGTGFDDLENGLVDLLQGQITTISSAGRNAQFIAPLSPDQRAAYNAQFPDRFAFKHAFSTANPERDWGRDVIDSIQFAFYVLNLKFPDAAISKKNTIVIASSVSNGGGSSLRAIEQDADGLIDGAAVSEPNVNPGPFSPFTISQGGNSFTATPTPLIDYITFLNIYEGCAAVSQTTAPFNLAPSTARCTSLKADGLLTSSTIADQAVEAQHKINAFGFLLEQNFVQPVLWFSYVPQAIAVTYANSYGRFTLADNLCGISFAATDSNGKVTPLGSTLEQSLFAVSNGIPPTPFPSAGPAESVNLVNNAAGLEDRLSSADQDLTAALCFRSLATGTDPVTGAPVPDDTSARVQAGQQQVTADGNLHGVPVIIVDGRADDILPPNFVVRAYVGLNAQREGRRNQLHYYEVSNANHLDDILALPGFDTTLVPLQKYFLEAMDLIYAHLHNGASLPPSQVVHTTPRGGTPGAAPPITLSNVPDIQSNPGANAIVFSNNTLTIPQ